jgi:hypothetical protein
MTPQEEEYRLIPLTQGQWAIVNAIDYDDLMRWKWYARWNPGMNSFYACRKIKLDGKTITVQMHRHLLGLAHGDPRKGDHRFHDTLDNRRFIDGRRNLRIATHGQNLTNMKVRSNNISGYPGVYQYKRTLKWIAYITANKKRTHLGCFDLFEDAKQRRIAAEKELHGEFARTA